MPAASPEEILSRLERYLSQALRSEAMVLSGTARDGRLNSQDNERQISHALQLYAVSNEWFSNQGLRIEIAPPRHWYDFAVTSGDGVFLPVNVKVSALKTSDNISSKEGVFYALTGVTPDSVRINTWELFCERLAARLGENSSADYYFMVVGKTNPGEVFWTGLKKITELVPNGNNPPFQCNWGRNRHRADRSEHEAQSYILATLRETFRLRAEALRSFDSHLGRFL